ncbi:Hsp70 family protein, partial [Acinetobacter soli]
GKPVIIENKEGQRTTPSVIYIDDKGNTTVGKQAKNMAVSMPKNVVNESKRLMGTDTKIEVNGKMLRPEEAGARVLEYLVRSAEERTGQKVDEAIITVPAYFNDTQRRATQKAAEIAKLKLKFCT